jgi:hypothetical protein
VYAGIPDQRRHGPQRRREHGQHVAGGGHSQPGGGKPSILSPEVIEAVRDLRSAGKSPRAIADRLNAYGQRSLRGGRWHRTSVRRLLDRLDAEATAA